MEPFDEAFDILEGFEGKNLSNVKGDPGEETYAGISRAYWPTWPGWLIINKYKKGGKIPAEQEAMLLPLVKKFYRINFWDRFQGDVVAEISKKIAFEIFEASVNLDVPDAVKFLQTALNMQNNYGSTYPDLIVDGKFGKNTINTLKRYLDSRPGSFELNEEILLNCMNGEQYIHYKNNPKHEGFRGWFRRV